MHALSRSPISDTHFFMSGIVIIDPSAAIAPGVLIQADEGAQVVIRAGVCIGRGSIIHASSGLIELSEGATLGTGVLIFGEGNVGSGACVGANVTVVNHTVKPGQLVPANSILSSLEIPNVTVPESKAETNGRQVVDSVQSEESSTTKDSGSKQPSTDTPPPIETPPPINASTQSEAASAVEAEVQSTEVNVKTQRVVYGRASVDQILTMMFPHRQALNSSSSTSDLSNDSQKNLP